MFLAPFGDLRLHGHVTRQADVRKTRVVYKNTGSERYNYKGSRHLTLELRKMGSFKAVRKMMGLAFGGFPKLGVPFWGSL